jgi:hypothetical protein
MYSPVREPSGVKEGGRAGAPTESVRAEVSKSLGAEKRHPGVLDRG